MAFTDIFKKDKTKEANQKDWDTKWAPMDTDNDGTATVEEQKAYAEKQKNNRKTVKAVDKGGTTVGKVNAVNEDDPEFYTSDTPPAGLNKKQQERWYAQKDMLQKGGTTTVVQNEPKKEEADSTPKTSIIDSVKKEPTEQPKSAGYTGMDAATDKAMETAKTFANKNEEMKDLMARNEQNRSDEGTYEEQNNARNAGPRDDQSTFYTNRNGVDTKNGNIYYDSVPTEGGNVIRKIKNYKKVKNSDEQVQGWNKAKDYYDDRVNDVDEANSKQGKLQNGITSSIESAQRENDKAINGLNKELEAGYQKDIHAKQDQLNAYNKSLKSYDEFLEENGEDPKQWSWDVQQAFNEIAGTNPESAKIFNDSLQNRQKLQSEIDWMKDVHDQIQSGEASWADLGEYEKNELLGQLQQKSTELANDIVTSEKGTLDGLDVLTEKYGTPEQKELLGQIHTIYFTFKDSTGMDLSSEARQQMVEGLQRAKDGLREETNNDLAIGDARREMVSSINKFMFFAIDDAITAYSLYLTLDIGNPADAIGKLSQMGKRNAAYSNAEVGFKTGILNNEAENVKRDQTAQSQADYDAIQNDVELQKYLQQKNIDSEEVVREMQALRKAYQQYQTYNDGGFEAFYTAKMLQNSNNNGIAGILSSAVQAGALNLGALERLITGGTTDSDENDKVGIVNLSTKGKTNSWIDNAMNAAAPKEETEQHDPMVFMDKQNVATQAMQQRQVNPQNTQQSQQPAPKTGWGSTQH